MENFTEKKNLTHGASAAKRDRRDDVLEIGMKETERRVCVCARRVCTSINIARAGKVQWVDEEGGE